MSVRKTMSSILPAVFLFIAFAQSGFAQSINDSKWEFSAGYSQTWVKSNVKSLTFTTPDGGSDGFTDLCSQATGEHLGLNSQKFFCKRRGFDGFDLSGTYNINRYVGIMGNVSGGSRSEKFVDDFGGIIQTIRVKEKMLSVLAGVQLKDNASDSRFRPFVHALVGETRYTNRQSQDIDAFPQFDFDAKDSETSLTVKLGGGIDLRLGSHIDLRLIQLDYQPVFAGDRKMKTISGPFTFHVEGKTAQNYSAGFGIVIH